MEPLTLLRDSPYPILRRRICLCEDVGAGVLTVSTIVLGGNIVHVLRSVFLSAVLVLVVSGCGGSSDSTPSVSTDTLESTITDKLEAQVGQRPDSVSCPDALKGKVGETVRCTLTSGTTSYGITVTAESVKGKNVQFDIQVDEKPQ